MSKGSNSPSVTCVPIYFILCLLRSWFLQYPLPELMSLLQVNDKSIFLMYTCFETFWPWQLSVTFRRCWLISVGILFCWYHLRGCRLLFCIDASVDSVVFVCSWKFSINTCQFKSVNEKYDLLSMAQNGKIFIISFVLGKVLHNTELKFFFFILLLRTKIYSQLPRYFLVYIYVFTCLVGVNYSCDHCCFWLLSKDWPGRVKDIHQTISTEIHGRLFLNVVHIIIITSDKLSALLFCCFWRLVQF